MNELIPTTEATVDGQSTPTCDARELHIFLESKRQFADWIKDRIAKYNFVENQDYVTFKQNHKSSHGGQNRIEYLLTLKATIQLAVSENNAQGRALLKELVEKRDKFNIQQHIAHLMEDFDAKDLAPDQFIYVAQESVSKRYKVGISKNPVARVSALNVGNPETLTLVALYKANGQGRLSETKAHRFLEPYHIRGEWFSIVDGLETILEPASLPY